MKYSIETSTSSALAICECGSRLLGGDRAQASRLLASHEATAHPHDHNARRHADTPHHSMGGK